MHLLIEIFQKKNKKGIAQKVPNVVPLCKLVNLKPFNVIESLANLKSLISVDRTIVCKTELFQNIIDS